MICARIPYFFKFQTILLFTELPCGEYSRGKTGTTTGEREKPDEFPRPMLEADSTLEAWEDFQATWYQ